MTDPAAMNLILPYWAIIFAAALNAEIAAFEPKVAIGPFDTLELCSAVAALAIGSPGTGLNDKHPEKDFRAGCSHSSALERHPGEPLYDLRQLAAMAGAPLEGDRQ